MLSALKYLHGQGYAHRNLRPETILFETDMSIYDLKIVESIVGATTYNVLVATTQDGLWYSIDDGDNWYRTGTATDTSITPILCNYFPSNNISVSIGWIFTRFNHGTIYFFYGDS